MRADGVSVATAIDGTKTATATTGDPRFGGGAQLLAERTTTTPAGKSRTTTITRSVTLRDQQDPFSLEEMTVLTKTGDGFDDPQFFDRYRAESEDDDGPITSRTIERSTGIFGEDPEVKTLDARGRVTAVDPDGESGPLDPITYTWGANGRVTEGPAGHGEPDVRLRREGPPELDHRRGRQGRDARVGPRRPPDQAHAAWRRRLPLRVRRQRRAVGGQDARHRRRPAAARPRHDP